MIGDNITRYKQQQNRKMHLQDLDKLFGYSSSDEVLKKLREISPTWQEDLFEAGDDTIIEDGIAFYNQAAFRKVFNISSRYGYLSKHYRL